MDLPSLKSILSKLKILNNNRMAEIKDQWVRKEADRAEYEDRFKQRNWYDQTIMEIDIHLSGRNLQTLKITRDELQLKIEKRLESKYDEVLERTRQDGAGTMTDGDHIMGFVPEDLDEYEKGPDCDNNMSMEDREFLESCGIKTEKGETW